MTFMSQVSMIDMLFIQVPWMICVSYIMIYINDNLDVNHVDSNVSSWKNEVITLKNGFGHMRK